MLPYLQELRKLKINTVFKTVKVFLVQYLKRPISKFVKVF